MKYRNSIMASAALVAALAVSCTKAEPKPWDEEPVRTDVLEEGYYKDIFMDAGIALTAKTYIPSAAALGMEMEYFSCTSDTLKSAKEDTLYQRLIMSDSDGSVLPADANGVLIYPDGEPRFKMIYMNGGKSSHHTRSMQDNGGCQGMQRIRDFYYNGGGYLGTCAGAFMTGTGYDDKENYSYLRICSFKPKHTKVNDSFMSMSIEPGCPLLNYYTFGGDNLIENIYHNGGCYANDGLCTGAEALLRYSTAGHDNQKARECNGKISSWAFKRDIYSGRLCAIGSHPENITSGERLDLMCAYEKYAIDGRGIATIKDTLLNGKEVAMTKASKDSLPNHTMIGDCQNHHFALWVPEGAKNLTITLQRLGGETYEDCELNLYVKKGTFAFKTEKLDAAIIGTEDYKSTTFTTPEKGLYYVCVNCATTVEATPVSYTSSKGQTGNYFLYSGHTEVLNGVPYTIKATWE